MIIYPNWPNRCQSTTLARPVISYAWVVFLLSSPSQHLEFKVRQVESTISHSVDTLIVGCKITPIVNCRIYRIHLTRLNIMIVHCTWLASHCCWYCTQAGEFWIFVVWHRAWTLDLELHSIQHQLTFYQFIIRAPHLKFWYRDAVCCVNTMYVISSI